MRGRVPGIRKDLERMGITPAYAGKSYTRTCYAYNVRDHPRVCGEEAPVFLSLMARTGSPPRMRGRVSCRVCSVFQLGITPAYAGKSAAAPLVSTPARDHPRVCGEEVQVGPHFRVKEGSPPRMRGRGIVPKIQRPGCGITPAYAGKRAFFFLHNLPFWDHPRVCGEECAAGG